MLFPNLSITHIDYSLMINPLTFIDDRTRFKFSHFGLFNISGLTEEIVDKLIEIQTVNMYLHITHANEVEYIRRYIRGAKCLFLYIRSEFEIAEPDVSWNIIFMHVNGRCVYTAN